MPVGPPGSKRCWPGLGSNPAASANALISPSDWRTAGQLSSVANRMGMDGIEAAGSAKAGCIGKARWIRRCCTMPVPRRKARGKRAPMSMHPRSRGRPISAAERQCEIAPRRARLRRTARSGTNKLYPLCHSTRRHWEDSYPAPFLFERRIVESLPMLWLFEVRKAVLECGSEVLNCLLRSILA
jgi:hypothetical protein